MISFFKVKMASKQNLQKLHRHLTAIYDEQNDPRRKGTLIAQYENTLKWELSLVTSKENAEIIINTAKEGTTTLLLLILIDLEKYL